MQTQSFFPKGIFFIIIVQISEGKPWFCWDHCRTSTQIFSPESSILLRVNWANPVQRLFTFSGRAYQSHTAVVVVMASPLSTGTGKPTLTKSIYHSFAKQRAWCIDAQMILMPSSHRWPCDQYSALRRDFGTDTANLLKLNPADQYTSLLQAVLFCVKHHFLATFDLFHSFGREREGEAGWEWF